MFYFDVSSNMPAQSAQSAHPANFAHCEQAEQVFFGLIPFFNPMDWEDS